MKKILNVFKEQSTQWKSDWQKIKNSANNYLEYLDINQPIIPVKKFAKYRGRVILMIEEINKQIRKVTTHEELVQEYESIYFSTKEEPKSVKSKDEFCKYEIMDNWTSKWLNLMIPHQQANYDNSLKPKKKKKSYEKSNSKVHLRKFQLWLHRSKSIAVKKEKPVSNQYNEEKLFIKKRIANSIEFPKIKSNTPIHFKSNSMNRSSYNSKPPTRRRHSIILLTPRKCEENREDEFILLKNRASCNLKPPTLLDEQLLTDLFNFNVANSFIPKPKIRRRKSCIQPPLSIVER
jgi:hypothetical protein